MKVVADRTKCSSIGLVEATAPDIFEIGPDGVMNIRSRTSAQTGARDVEQACPGTVCSWSIVEN